MIQNILSRMTRLLPKILLALSAIVAADLAAGLAYWAVTDDSFYYSVIHPDRGENRRYRKRSELYHHDLRPSVSTPASWGKKYRVHTNSLGFRDRETREVDRETDAPRILIIGDSFAEGVRVNFDETVAGILAAHFRPQGIDVLNAGVSSYSPTIYQRKMRYLLDEIHLRVSQVLVLLDVSDIEDDAKAYRVDADGNVDSQRSPGSKLIEILKAWQREYSILYGLLRLFESSPAGPASGRNASVNNPRARWTLDEELYRSFGERGLRVAAQRMDELADLLHRHRIPLTLVVYPWPTQIFYQDWDSIHVRFWRDWSRRQGAQFIDLFPGFLSEDAEENERTIRDLFIRDDFHWNEAGHRHAAEGIIAEWDPTLPLAKVDRGSSARP